jgi:hypothetical protein
MSDGEDNDDLYDSDAPSEESERDEDSPQDGRVDICWLTNSDPVASTSSVIGSLMPTSTVVTNSPADSSMDAVPATAPTNAAIDVLLVKITGTELGSQDFQTAIDGDGNGGGQLSAPQHKQTYGLGKEGPNPGQKKTTGFGHFQLDGKTRWFVQVMVFTTNNFPRTDVQITRKHFYGRYDNPVYVRHVNSSYLGSSRSSHRQSYIGLVFSSRFIHLIINRLRRKIFGRYSCTYHRIFSRSLCFFNECGTREERRERDGAGGIERRAVSW